MWCYLSAIISIYEGRLCSPHVSGWVYGSAALICIINLHTPHFPLGPDISCKAMLWWSSDRAILETMFPSLSLQLIIYSDYTSRVERLDEKTVIVIHSSIIVPMGSRSKFHLESSALYF